MLAGCSSRRQSWGWGQEAGFEPLFLKPWEGVCTPHPQKGPQPPQGQLHAGASHCAFGIGLDFCLNLSLLPQKPLGVWGSWGEWGGFCESLEVVFTGSRDIGSLSQRFHLQPLCPGLTFALPPAGGLVWLWGGQQRELAPLLGEQPFGGGFPKDRGARRGLRVQRDNHLGFHQQDPDLQGQMTPRRLRTVAAAHLSTSSPGNLVAQPQGCAQVPLAASCTLTFGSLCSARSPSPARAAERASEPILGGENPSPPLPWAGGWWGARERFHLDAQNGFQGGCADALLCRGVQGQHFDSRQEVPDRGWGGGSRKATWGPLTWQDYPPPPF